MSKYLFLATGIFIIDAILSIFGVDIGRKFVDDSHHTTVDFFHQLYIGLFFLALGLLIQHAEKSDDRIIKQKLEFEKRIIKILNKCNLIMRKKNKGKIVDYIIFKLHL